MKFDFHLHTTFSDGVLSPGDLARLCLEKGMEQIAICDHWGTKKYSKEFQVVDLEAYYENISQLKDSYKNKLKIFIGLEIDFSQKYGAAPPGYPFQHFNKLDFLLFEHVDTPAEAWGTVNGRSLEEVIALRDKIDTRVGLAHNHFQKNYQGRELAIIEQMKKNQIFLELCQAEDKGKQVVDKRILKQLLEIKKNVKEQKAGGETKEDLLKKLKQAKKPQLDAKKHAENGKYYFEHFSNETWQAIKEYKLPLSVGSDSHKGHGVGKNDILNHYIQKYDLESQIVIPMTDNR
jgi:HisJ family histidinol phosphate phosphatase